MATKWWGPLVVLALVGMWIVWAPGSGSSPVEGGPDIATALDSGGDIPLKASTPVPASRRSRRDDGPANARGDGPVRGGDDTAASRADEAGARPVPANSRAATASIDEGALPDEPVARRRLLGRWLAEGRVAGADYDRVSGWLDELNRRPDTSLLPLIDASEYVVQPGDSLWGLCNKLFPRELGVSPEVGLVQLVNDLSGNGLHVGQRLVVPLEALTIVVDSRQNGLAAFLGDAPLVAYRVGLGKENRTPIGTFVIDTKQEHPPWYREGRMIPYGDPENILGTRWMGFEDRPGVSGYGIHGTAEPETIGENRSMGCIRMRNEQVEALFELVPRGTEVTIR